MIKEEYFSYLYRLVIDDLASIENDCGQLKGVLFSFEHPLKLFNSSLIV